MTDQTTLNTKNFPEKALVDGIEGLPIKQDDRQDDKKQVAVSAFWVALGTLTSRGLGFLRDMTMVDLFSATQTDAFFVAFRLPNLFRRLFGEGAMTVSFIPVFTDFIKNKDKKGARELASAVFTMLFVILSIITIIGTFGADSIINVLSSGEGFTSVPGKMELTIHQTRILFCYIMLVSIYAFFMGILNTFRVFWLPAVAPALWNLSMLVGMLFFRHVFNLPSDILAWSAVIGGVLQALILVPSLHRLHFIPHLRKWWGNPAVKRVLRAMGPSILGLSVMQLAVLINTYFASHLEEGSNSWLFLADRMLELPLSIFAVSIGTAALPMLASLWSKGDKKGMSEASLHALKLSLFMAIPCAVGIFFLSGPIVHALFEHGKFGPHASVMTASILRMYGFNVIFATGVRVLAPSFYAMKNTWLPAMSASIALCCHIVIASILTKKFGVVGLATSSVTSGGINFLILLIAYQKMIMTLEIRKLIVPIGKFFVASIGLGCVALFHQPVERIIGDSHVGRVASLVIVIGFSAVAYLAISYALKTNELLETVGEFQKRIKRKWAK